VASHGAVRYSRRPGRLYEWLPRDFGARGLRGALHTQELPAASRKIDRVAVADVDDDSLGVEALGGLAGEVLTDLYYALSGHSPRSVRVYGEADALLLLLRFDPAELAGSSESRFEPLTDTTFIALPSMIASAVQRRAGARLYPGNLSVCADRGLAVFAFSALALEAAGPSARGDSPVLVALQPSWTEDPLPLQLADQPPGLL
jgi:hypothetical protein